MNPEDPFAWWRDQLIGASRGVSDGLLGASRAIVSGARGLGREFVSDPTQAYQDYLRGGASSALGLARFMPGESALERGLLTAAEKAAPEQRSAHSLLGGFAGELLPDITNADALVAPGRIAEAESPVMKALEASAFLPFVPGGLLGRAMRRVDDLPEAGGLLRTPDAPTGEVVDQMARFRAKWDSRGVDNWVSEGDNHIVLSQVVVPEGQRGQGVGSDFMEELTAYADEVGKPLLLTPSADFGGSVPRLREFYSRYGFKPNKGSMRDHSLPNESMRRNPNSLRSDDLPEAGGLLRTPDAPTGASKIIPRKR